MLKVHANASLQYLYDKFTIINSKLGANIMAVIKPEKLTGINVTELLERYGDVGRLALIQMLMMPTVFYMCWLVQEMY